MSPARAHTQTAWSGDEGTNSEATVLVASKRSEMFDSLQPALYLCVVVFLGEDPFVFQCLKNFPLRSWESGKYSTYYLLSVYLYCNWAT